MIMVCYYMFQGDFQHFQLLRAIILQHVDITFYLNEEKNIILIK